MDDQRGLPLATGGVADGVAAEVPATEVGRVGDEPFDIRPADPRVGDDGVEVRHHLVIRDRDWRIRIHAGVEHDIAEIRVMQSYALPTAKGDAEFDSPGRKADGGYVANFYAQLPVDAVLLSFRADTDAAASVAPQIAKLMTHQAFTNMSSAAMRALRKSYRLVVLTNGPRLESDSILNLTPGETVTVEYTYTMPVKKFNPHGAFVLNIVLQGEASPLMSAPATASTSVSSAPISTPTTGTVWVEWIDAHPTQVTSTASDIYIERVSHDAEGGNDSADADVIGASWFSPDLSAAPQFTLRWNRLPSAAAVNTASHISLSPTAKSR